MKRNILAGALLAALLSLATTSSRAAPCAVTTLAQGVNQVIAPAANVYRFSIANVDATTGGGEAVIINWDQGTAASTPGGSNFPLAPPTSATTLAGMGTYTSPSDFAPHNGLFVYSPTAGHKIACSQW